MSLFSKKNKNAPREPQSRLYKIIQSVSITAVFVAVGLLVLGVSGIFNFTSFTFGLIATIAIIAIAGVLMLPWVRHLERLEYRKVSIVFMIAIAACAVLWIVSVYMGIGVYRRAKIATGDDDAGLFATLKFIKVVLIITLQFLMASLVASTVIKYQKRLIAFQAITYLSNLFFDFYVTYFLCCITVNADGLAIADGAMILLNKFMLALFVMSIIFMAISSKIMQVVEERRFRYAAEDAYHIDGSLKEQPVENEAIEAKLEKLKQLREKDLISEEEYQKKRSDLLEKM